MKKEEEFVVEPHSIDVVAREGLTGRDLELLRLLFDREYLKTFGPWDPEQPYGYAGHDTHVIARASDDGIVAQHSVSRTGIPVTVEPGPPLLVLPLDDELPWPTGSIDLRGRAW